MRDLDAAVERFTEKFADVGRALDQFAEAVAMSSLPTAEQYVARQPRRHYADPELTEPDGTEGQ